jgi:hypothetical protein
MRIPEYFISDLKDLGKNHLAALGFGLTGYLVAYSVNKACRWFFQSQDRDSDAAAIRKGVFELMAAGLGLQACLSLGKRTLGDPESICVVNPRIFVLHIAAFALASLRDPKKIIRAGVCLSAATILISPSFIGVVGATFGSFGDELNRHREI